jgi:hypothetical protein
VGIRPESASLVKLHLSALKRPVWHRNDHMADMSSVDGIWAFLERKWRERLLLSSDDATVSHAVT